ncbi:putative oxidoreductase [Escherichia coli]|nr:putative oxidoreductase [Escherichia coli]
MPQQNYLDELTPAFTSLLAIKEASRCLLCHDAPCSQACPAQTDPGNLFAQSTFVILKALPRQFAKIMPRCRLCQSVPDGEIMPKRLYPCRC